MKPLGRFRKTQRNTQMITKTSNRKNIQFSLSLRLEGNTGVKSRNQNLAQKTHVQCKQQQTLN